MPEPPSAVSVAPPTELSKKDLNTIFEHFKCRLADYRNNCDLYAIAEYQLSTSPDDQKKKRIRAFNRCIQNWAQELLEKAWVVCGEPSGEKCPELDKYVTTSTSKLPPLPDFSLLRQTLTSILFLSITTTKYDTKQYSARTRHFLGTFGNLDEDTVVSTLKNPEAAMEKAKQQAETVEEERKQQADNGKVMRWAGAGLAAVAGGVLVTGGLAAPLVGAAATSVLSILGLGGTVAGVLATGLASSGAVCGILFGAYGSHRAATMVQRHIREVSDLAIVPVRENKSEKGRESLSVKMCVSGWLEDPGDVSKPWKVFGDDTFAMQYEVKALQELSDALYTLIKSNAWQMVKAEIIQRTIFAALMMALAPMALLKVGQIADNPWMNARALSYKAGRVLGSLLQQRLFGARPVSLAGYSLGSLVIFEALQYLASLPPEETTHLIQDVYLFGTPTSVDPAAWAGIRRLVSGRLVNGYASEDYILAVLSRAASGKWEQAGLRPVDKVSGVENVLCSQVKGHLQWRTMVGICLRDEAHAEGVMDNEVERLVKELKDSGEWEHAEEEKEMTKEKAQQVMEHGDKDFEEDDTEIMVSDNRSGSLVPDSSQDHPLQQ